jgi:cardiolipin synthase C
MKRWLIAGLWLLFAGFALQARAAGPMSEVDAQIAAHPGQSGAYVLDTGAEALVTRAWLADHAERTLEAQYFIWSTDNIGILATAALLRAAERGVKVRVIVDDLLIDAPDKSLLALAKHPNIDIRIYNPKTTSRKTVPARVANALGDLRGVNQRMHDKTVIVDGKVAVTGGRNMAAEYFDYNQKYNFRDRDVLLIGEVAGKVQASFERFWASPLSVKVEDLYDGLGLMRKNVRVDDTEVQFIYRGLEEYARSPANFAPEVRASIDDVPTAFPRLAAQLVWGRVDFVSDIPGKNESSGLDGGGLTTTAIAELVKGAKERVVIQSPYLVPSDKAMEILRQARARGVRIRICTNSLASTDNIQAFSGYRNTRAALLALGVEIFEYKPDPEIQQELMRRAGATLAKRPVFAIHAKSMVIDSKLAWIGTFNFDPRSANLNTEVGAVIHNEALARAVEAAIETDMKAANSWSAADDPDKHASLGKRAYVRMWQMLPLKPLL